jgi:hypothetical protein
MKQQSLEAPGFEVYQKKTRKEKFLDDMEQIIPWSELTEAIKPYYPKDPKSAGRSPIGLERTLRIHFLQHWFELSDPAAEEALYDSRAMRHFVGIDLADDLGSTVGHHIRIGDTRHRNADLAVLRRIPSLENLGLAAEPGAPDIDN